MADQDGMLGPVVLGESTLSHRPGMGARRKAQELAAERPFRTALARVFGVHTDERAWRVGAEGEARVGRLLRRLPDGWHVFHDLPIRESGSNIDHLVIGPPGVFCLNTKNLSGRVSVTQRGIWVNGHRTSYDRTGRWETDQVRQRMRAVISDEFPCFAVVVVLARELEVKSQPLGLDVVRAGGVVRWLQRRPQLLTPGQVFDLGKVAHRASTWARAAAH